MICIVLVEIHLCLVVKNNFVFGTFEMKMKEITVLKVPQITEIPLNVYVAQLFLCILII